MAIYHLSVKAISRSSGRTSTGAAAYRSGEKIVNEKTGEVFDYTRKTGVGLTGIVMPDNAEWTPTRSELWNAAELAEKRKDACVAREHEIALPKELTDQERYALVRDYAKDLANRHGCAVDYAIHHPHRDRDGETNENWHAHLLTTTREVVGDGLGPKCQREKAGQNRAADLELERSTWASHANAALERAGHAERIDHRSLEAQGITDREPTSHKGVAVVGMERRGIETDVGQRLAAAQAEGERQRAEAAALASQKIDLTTSLTSALASREAVSKELRHDRHREFQARTTPTRKDDLPRLHERHSLSNADRAHHLLPGNAFDLLGEREARERADRVQRQNDRVVPSNTPAAQPQAPAQPVIQRVIQQQPAPVPTFKPAIKAEPVQAAPAKALDVPKPAPVQATADVSHRAHLSESDRELLVNIEKSIAALDKGRDGADAALASRLTNLDATIEKAQLAAAPVRGIDAPFDQAAAQKQAISQRVMDAECEVNRIAKEHGIKEIPFPQPADDVTKGYSFTLTRAKNDLTDHLRTAGGSRADKEETARLQGRVAHWEKAVDWAGKAVREVAQKLAPRDTERVEKARERHTERQAADKARTMPQQLRAKALEKERDRLHVGIRKLPPEKQQALKQRQLEYGRQRERGR